METVRIICQITVAAGIFNVWILRCKKSTPYRGGSASTLQEEFAAYGLPFGVMCLVGLLKILSAIGLILGIWLPELLVPSASLLSLLMIGALFMHAKVKDPPSKSIPALGVLLLCLLIIFI